MEVSYKGTNKMIIGVVFGVLTFWLFAQSMVNVIPAVEKDLGVWLGLLNVAISLTALFSGIFVVAAGGLADKIGRKKMTYIGLVLSIIGSLCLIITNGSALLIIGRIIQGLSAACIMPATIALVRTYFEGADRQRALSYWSFGSWGGIVSVLLQEEPSRPIWGGSGFLSFPSFSQCNNVSFERHTRKKSEAAKFFPLRFYRTRCICCSNDWVERCYHPRWGISVGRALLH